MASPRRFGLRGASTSRVISVLVCLVCLLSTTALEDQSPSLSSWHPRSAPDSDHVKREAPAARASDDSSAATTEVVEKELPTLRARASSRRRSAAKQEAGPESPAIECKESASDVRGTCPPGFFCLQGKCNCPAVREIRDGNCEERTGTGYTGWVSLNSTKLQSSGVRHQPMLKEAGGKGGKGGGQVADIPWGRCAVVASSRVLVRKRQGDEIDSHDTVIRFNEAPTKGHEKSAGSKTTLRVQNSSWCGFSERGEYCMAFQGGVTHSCKWGKKGAKGNSCRVIAPPEELERVADNYLKALNVPKSMLSRDKAAKQYGKRIRQRASGGFFGVLLAVNMCTSVDIYGFTNSGGSDHYYRKTVARGIRKPWSMKHHWTVEKAAFQELKRGALPNVRIR
ncbi:glycosyltransferase family 29 protein [Pseudoscourfieldia marina]